MQQGPPQLTAYNFPSTFTADFSVPSHASSTAQAIPPHLIDPRLRPLPQGNDRDLTHPSTIAKAALRPAVKVGGVRQKDKGKKRRLASDSSEDSDDAAPVTKRGRPQGSSNYNKDDTKRVLKIAEKKLPLGAKGWKAVTRTFNKWAVENERPERTVKSIETKYRQLVQKKKPTGEGHCPPDVKHAHRIEALINQKADTRQLSDSEFDDGDAGDGDASSDDVVEVVPTTVHTAIARRAPSPPLRRGSSPPPRRSRMNAPELVNQLSKAFDPKMSKARENERAERSFQTTHMLTVSQQLRDSQNTIENLRNQLTVMQARVYDAERARDFGEFKMQFLQAGGGPVFGSASAGPSASHPPRRAAVYKDNPDLVRDDGKVRYPSSDDEAEKENRNPSSSSHSGRSSSFSLHDDDTLVNYSLLPSTSGTAAEVKGAPSAAVVDGASNSGVGNI